MAYELFLKGVIGAGHIKRNIPCEDYGKKLEKGEFKAFAVADGHGDHNCFRSGIGSKLICEIATAELIDFAEVIKKENWEDSLFCKDNSENQIFQLIKSIVGKWLEAIHLNIEENPITDEEYELAYSYADEFKKGIGLERIFGTTLIAGIAGDKYLLLIQQGDGRCVVFDENGKAEQPIPWDDRCVGTITTSLCDSDVLNSFRYHIIDLEKKPVIAVIAGTDGVEDSFPGSMDKTHAYYRNILEYACLNGISELEKYLETDLSDLSKNGSADDITICGIIDIDQTKKFLAFFEEENKLTVLMSEAADIENKISSIEEGGKLLYLSDKLSEAEYNLAKAEADLRRTEKEYSELILRLEEKGLDIKTAKEDVLRAEEMRKNAEEEYLPFMEKYRSLLDNRKDINEKLKEMTEKRSEVNYG